MGVSFTPTHIGRRVRMHATQVLDARAQARYPSVDESTYPQAEFGHFSSDGWRICARKSKNSSCTCTSKLRTTAKRVGIEVARLKPMDPSPD